MRVNYLQVLALSSLLACCYSLAQALPAGATGSDIASGHIQFHQPEAATLLIEQNTTRAVINWSSFDIAAGERVQFVQPSGGVTLNRIGGGRASEILGSLSAPNGTLMLVNPDGVFFGPNAQVDVASLVATSSNLRDSDFRAGILDFSSPGSVGATIENHGHINIGDGGFASLVAPVVRNRGSISARVGYVHFGSGEVFTLDPYGDGLINLAFTRPPTPQAQVDLASGSRTIADGGQVQLLAAGGDNLLRGIVNLNGTVQATRSGIQNGQVVLDADTLNLGGTLAANSVYGQAKQVNLQTTQQPLAQAVALTAPGGTLKLAAGTYTLAEALKLPAPITLRGYGFDAARASGTALQSAPSVNAGLVIQSGGVVLEDFGLFGGGIQGIAQRNRMEFFPTLPEAQPPNVPGYSDGPLLPNFSGSIPAAFYVSLLKNNLAAAPDVFGMVAPAAGDNTDFTGDAQPFASSDQLPTTHLLSLQSFLVSGLLAQDEAAAREALLADSFHE